MGGEGGFNNFLKGKANAEMKFHKQLSEIRSMHDFIYNKVEKKLLKENNLIRIPNGEKHNYSLKLRDSIGSTSFILAKGKISINDFSVLKNLLENWEDMSKFIARCTIVAKKDILTQAQAETTYNELMNNLTKNMNKETREGFLLLIDMFYKDR